MSDPVSLLPPNATDTEWHLEATTARIGDVATPLRDLWNADNCPVELLPWLAWTLSLDAWQPYWTEQVKRQRIKEAINIQRHKGTTKSVKDVVAAFGGALTLLEWWQQTPPATPHTFEVVLAIGGGQPATAAYQQDVIDEISRTKPVRSHFTLTAGLSASGGLGLQGVARPVTYTRISVSET